MKSSLYFAPAPPVIKKSFLFVHLMAAGFQFRSLKSPCIYRQNRDRRTIKNELLKLLLLFLISSIVFTASGQNNLIGNIQGRATKSLDGSWEYIIDPYETGFYDYRYRERSQNDPEAYWNTDIPAGKLDRKEFGYNEKYTLNVPGDWNSQDDKFLYYEGTVWYKKSFDYSKKDIRSKLYLYFGGVNYRADVYLNGKKLGMHKGGFTPFNFEIQDSILKPRNNFLVVKVDNKRYADEIPTLNTDWWNYGGITRTVQLVELPASSVINYFIQLKPGATNEIAGWVKIGNGNVKEKVQVEIPELKIKKTADAIDGMAKFDFSLPAFRAWSPGSPYRYRVIISTATDRVEENIGFRTISVAGKSLLLNGEPLFLRGISIHGEIPQQKRRASGEQDARQLLTWAKDLGCNMVRLAHYPHDEAMTRMADSIGLVVWSEIPVYWTIDFTSKLVWNKAKAQLDEMITRDQNRASIIIWSVGNETPVSDTRTEFMRDLLQEARQQDPSRLVSAALEVNYHSDQNLRSIDDPLGAYVDIVAFNQYLGWYGGTPESCRTATWATKYDKPLFISETGAEGLGGFHADARTLWSEEFQEWFYEEQVAMLKRMPDNYVGISPWILADFRSPRRNNPLYQEGWNNKGLIDQQGRKKKAFYVLQAYYNQLENQAAHNRAQLKSRTP